jgi:hypothetical protein
MCPVISRWSEIRTTSTTGLDLFDIAVTCNIHECKNLHVIYSRSQDIIKYKYSKISLIRCAWEWTGAECLNILYYQMVPVLTLLWLCN